MQKIYYVICGKYRKVKKLVFFVICSKYENEDEKNF